LKEMGYEVCSLASSGEKAIQITKKEKPDIVLMDVRLRGELSGIDTAKEIRSHFGIPSVYPINLIILKKLWCPFCMLQS